MISCTWWFKRQRLACCSGGEAMFVIRCSGSEVQVTSTRRKRVVGGLTKVNQFVFSSAASCLHVSLWSCGIQIMHEHTLTWRRVKGGLLPGVPSRNLFRLMRLLNLSAWARLTTTTTSTPCAPNLGPVDSLLLEQPVETIAGRRIDDERLGGPVILNCSRRVAPVHRADAVGVLL